MPNVFPSDPVLANADGISEPLDPFLDVDWSVSLRGSYTKATDEDRFDAWVVPEVSLEHISSRSALNLDGSVEVRIPTDGEQIDVGGLRLGLQGGYQLDGATRLTGDADLVWGRDVSRDIETISGGVGIGATRQFGRFNVGVTGAVDRQIYASTPTTDNTGYNYWTVDGGLRVGLKATPILEVFSEANLRRDMFDTAGTNANMASIKAGVTGRWSSVLEATASAGLGIRRFDNESLGETVTQLYDASVVFTPDPTWTMRAGLSTIVAPPGPDGAGTTGITYLANGEVGYQVNNWLALRALADWYNTRYEGSPDTEQGYGFGAGADYQINGHTSLTADYGFDHRDGSAIATRDAHTVTVGVTVSR